MSCWSALAKIGNADPEIIRRIIDVAKVSMGQDLSESDMEVSASPKGPAP